MPDERAAGPDWGVGNYERTAELLLPAAQVLVNAADLRTGERVLDLGSGTGSVAVLAAAAGARVTAVDPSQRLLGVAQEAAAQRDLDLTCLVGDAAHPERKRRLRPGPSPPGFPWHDASAAAKLFPTTRCKLSAALPAS